MAPPTALEAPTGITASPTLHLVAVPRRARFLPSGGDGDGDVRTAVQHVRERSLLGLSEHGDEPKSRVFPVPSKSAASTLPGRRQPPDRQGLRHRVIPAPEAMSPKQVYEEGNGLGMADTAGEAQDLRGQDVDDWFVPAVPFLCLCWSGEENIQDLERAVNQPLVCCQHSSPRGSSSADETAAPSPVV